MPADLRDKIADTWIELARRKSPEKITVRDLVDTCGIARQTFYYYFNDILALTEYIMQRGRALTRQACSKAADAREAIRFYLDDTLLYASIGRKTHRSEPHFNELSLENIRTLVRDMLSFGLVQASCSQEELDFVIDFFAAGMLRITDIEFARPTPDTQGLSILLERTLRALLAAFDTSRDL